MAAPLCDGGGYEASHVQDHGLLNARDEATLRHALNVGHIIISADSDFTTMPALTGMASLSLILLSSADHLNPEGRADLLLANLATVFQDL